MFGGMYFGQTYFAGVGATPSTSRRRFVHAVVRYLNPLRVMRLVRA